jgi:hypothetical protein
MDTSVFKLAVPGVSRAGAATWPVARPRACGD